MAAIAPSTTYVLMIRVDSTAGKAYFSVNGGTESELSTNLPAASTELGYVVHMVTTTASAKNIAIARVGCEFN